MITKLGEEIASKRKKSFGESALVGLSAGVGAPLTASIATGLVDPTPRESIK